MAIDRNQSREMLNFIDDAFQSIAKATGGQFGAKALELLIGPAVNEIRRIIDFGRPPRIFLLGKTGHGKTSLIGALSSKQMKTISEVTSGTHQAEKILLPFQDKAGKIIAHWDIVDSRGYDDIVKPENATEDNAIDQLRKEIVEHNPDIFIHVINADELKASKSDFLTVNKLRSSLPANNQQTPFILTLSKMDTLNRVQEWPPEEFPNKTALIKGKLDFFAGQIMNRTYKSIDLNQPYKGYYLIESDYQAVVPISSHLEFDDQGNVLKSSRRWNTDTLFECVGDVMPDEAILDLSQGGSKRVLKRLSGQIINRFTVIAGGVGAIPLADIVLLVPMQMLMIATIGGLSCRPFAKESVFEYFTAGGVNIGVASGTKLAEPVITKKIVEYLTKLGIKQSASKVIPGVGNAIGAALAASATYALGKAAEYYFFEGKIKEPSDFIEDGNIILNKAKDSLRKAFTRNKS